MSDIKDLEYKIKGNKVFEDNRGKIVNYELPEHINWLGLITSKKGTLRANHYHPIQEQKCVLLKGRYISVLKDLKDKNSKVTTQIINEGDLSVIPPNVVHTMIFIEDSIFLNLVNGEREHENFGKEDGHTIPYKLVDEKQKEDLIKNYKPDCRICGHNDIQRVISFGLQPLANNLLKNDKQEDELFPLELGKCEKCHNVQLSYVVPPENMFKNYVYVTSSTGDSFKNHFKLAAEKYIKDFGLNEKSLVVDIGSNCGLFLSFLKEKGIQVQGIDPAQNICDIANSRGIDTICDFFNSETILKIKDKKGRADIVTASNVFAHTDKIKELTTQVFDLLKDNGIFIIECQYLYDTIKDLTFDNVYHEHVSYFSVTSLNNLFNDMGLCLFDVEHINTHGGSIRCYIGRKENTIPNDSVRLFLEKERKSGLLKLETYERFAKYVERDKQNILNNIKKLKEQGKTIVGYGSPAKATTVLNYYGIDDKYIDFIIEDNNLKHNKLLPGVRIPIKSKSYLNFIPDYILVLAWNFFDEIKKNNIDLIEKGVMFITLKELVLPQFKLKKEFDDYNHGDNIVF